MNEVLQKIKELMEERGWSLYKLAKESGIPYSSLNSLFQKNNQPTITTLERICAGLHITLGEFFSDCTPYRQPEQEYNKEEKEIIMSYRNLNRNNKKLFLGFLTLLEKN
ncbi:helix-turn-helix transcriptional regulator [Lachnospiraceae bacterium 48-33]